MTAKIAIIGGGPAGLMAAEALSGAGHTITVYEAMPSLARKLLFAGKSGLNITHSEGYEAFVSRFGSAANQLRPALDQFKPEDVIAWAEVLGTKTFAGSSGRIFPEAMKASPLLRAWLIRLQQNGVTFVTRHRLIGLDGHTLTFATPDGEINTAADAIVLALGGGSWPKLGSNGDWVSWLKNKDVLIADLAPANCGFEVAWSAHFTERFAGTPVKSVTGTSNAGTSSGEFVVSATGIEGSLVYAHAATLRERLAANLPTVLALDLTPDRTEDKLRESLARQKPKASFATRLRKGAGLNGTKAALLRECVPDANRLSPEALARAIKVLRLPLTRARPLAEAISSAGGVQWAGIDDNYMLKALPGVFVAGEMLDWEAPTGGYLLTACMATGKAAGLGVGAWLKGSANT